MLPIIAGIVSMLADKGLSLISKAVDAGSDKAIEFVEQKTGIKLSEPENIKNISDEDIAKLKELEFTHKLELDKLALLNKQEDNRHEEVYVTAEVSDKQSARSNNHLYEMQSEIGKKVFLQTSILIPLLIMINVLLISYAADLKLGEAMISMVSTLIGIALNNAYRERQSMLEFLYGSSVGSKMNDK